MSKVCLNVVQNKNGSLSLSIIEPAILWAHSTFFNNTFVALFATKVEEMSFVLMDRSYLKSNFQ